MEHVLLTGAGQVGAQMIRILRNDFGVMPVVIDLAFDWDYLDRVVKRDWFIPVQGSILDTGLLDATLNKYEIRRISHSAAVLPMRVGHDPHPGFFEVNVHGTAGVLFTAAKNDVSRFVLFSTNGVYQFREYPVTGPVDEDFPTGLSTHNSYGNSKATVEFLLKELTLSGKIDGKIVRPGEIYGPVAERAGEDQIYWKAMIDAAIKGEPFSLVEHPEHRLDWVYAKDVARAACTVLMADEVPSIAYNLSYGRCAGIYNIKEELDRLFPGNEVTLKNCGRGGWKYPLNTRRLSEELGIEMKYDLADGIADYSEWMQGRDRPYQ